MYRFFNIFVNKIVNILIVAILILIAFFIGLNTTHALEATMWGTALENHINSLTSTSSYTYSDYNSDTIKEFIFNRSNEHFFNDTYTQSQFYKHYNYVVLGYSQTTIRVFVQNYDRVMDYQGLNPIAGNPTRFFFANMTINYRAGTSTYWSTGVNAIYSYYIDINYNTMSYTFSDNNPLTDLNFYLLGKGYHYRDSNKPFGSTDINMMLLDSYNGNFAWIESWYSAENTQSLWYQCSGYTTTSTILGYYNSIVEFPEFQYVSSGTPEDEPEEPGEGGETGGDDSDDSVLEGIVSDIKDIIYNVYDKVNDFIDWITGGFHSSDSESDISDFFNNFHDEDNGGISRIVKAPLRIIQNLNNSTCTPLILPIFGTEVEVPSGCILWENATEEIETLWHTIICGIGSYILLIDLFKEIQKLKNPRNGEVSTLDL